MAKSVTPGYKVVYPNRDKAASKTVKLVVLVIMLASAALLLILTFGGWSKLQGLKGVNLIWIVLEIAMAFFIFARWARGLLPIAAGLGVLLLMLGVVGGLGLSGTSWLDRSQPGFAPAQTPFGGSGLPSDLLGLLTILLIPVQAVLIFFTMLGFKQGWNVETEVPEDESKRNGDESKRNGDESNRNGDGSERNGDKSSSSSSEPATA